MLVRNENFSEINLNKEEVFVYVNDIFANSEIILQTNIQKKIGRIIQFWYFFYQIRTKDEEIAEMEK